MKKVVRVKALLGTPFLVSEDSDMVVGRGSYGTVVRAFNKQHP